MENIFAMGLDPFDLELLKTIGGGEEYRFHTAFEPSEVVRPETGEYPCRTTCANQHEPRSPRSRDARPLAGGSRLSEPGFPDSYSHEIAVVFPGTDRHNELLDRGHRMEKPLPFEIHPTGEEAP